MHYFVSALPVIAFLFIRRIILVNYSAVDELVCSTEILKALYADDKKINWRFSYVFSEENQRQ